MKMRVLFSFAGIVGREDLEVHDYYGKRVPKAAAYAALAEQAVVMGADSPPCPCCAGELIDELVVITTEQLR